MAWYVSASQLLPGKTTMPMFTRHPFHPSVVCASRDFVSVLLDQRVGEKPLTHLAHALVQPVGRFHLDLEVTTRPYRLHAAVPQRAEPFENRLPRCVEHARLQRHDDPHRPHAACHACASARAWPTSRR